MTEAVQEIFTIKEQKNRPYEFVDNVQFQITWEFDLNLYRIDRDVYGVLDWIGDLGGFFEGLLVIGLLLSSWYQYSFDNYLIEHLFVKQEGW